MEARTAQQIWETALGELQLQVSKPNYRTWLKNTEGLRYQVNEFIVGVPNTFVAEYLDKNQRSLIEKTLIGILHRDVKVTFSVNGSRAGLEDLYGDPVEKKPHGYQLRLNPRYTFDAFVVSDTNRLAHAAARGVAENPGQSYNPLFIYGGVGLGKTHLLHAIGNTAGKANMNVLYTSAEHYTNEFIESVRERKTEEFRKKYRSTDMLLVDDIQFICGKEQTAESFFHTFNDLHNANKQIAVTSNSPPKAMDMEERLCSRFEMGLMVDVQPPGYDTRLAILQAKARSEGFEIAGEVLEFIAQRIQQNIRELEGSLNRVIAYARLLRTTISLKLAEEAIQDIATKQSPSPPSPRLIMESVARNFQIDLSGLAGRKRDRQTTSARQIAMYLIRNETSWSLEQIGREIGNREPITVSQACKKVSQEINTSQELRDRVQAIKRDIGTGQ